MPDKEVLRISNRIQTLCDNPRPIGVQKLTDAEGYRIRVGNYRVLYEIDDKAKIIFVYRVKHRSEAYS
ncbi:MAG: type II toxin-antitoxin system RelE/ParE family toxin [Bacteroidetes bacterium]|nr:type II toxin-antitoxin system RelE/ParE family toxin [Bacteroidota bacterium]